LKPELLRLSNTLFVAVIFAYLVAMAAFFAHAIWRKRFTEIAAIGITVLALATHIASFVTRGLAAGRVPWGNMYEFSLTGTAIMVTAFLAGVYPRFRMPLVGGAVLAAAILILGVGWVHYPGSVELVPALRSRWLTFHVFLAMSGSSILGLGALLSGAYLLKLWWEGRNLSALSVPDDVSSLGALTPTPARVAGPGAALAAPAKRGLLARLPPSERIDQAAYRIILFAFPIWTMAIIAGAIWGEQAWGRYWGWDPKETWSFVVWVIFAGYLHARATAGWKGRRAAWLAVSGGTALVINFYAVNLWISGLHSYSGV
jgi:cytochrome c-type biogenesis protein CcsB